MHHRGKNLAEGIGGLFLLLIYGNKVPEKIERSLGLKVLITAVFAFWLPSIIHIFERSPRRVELLVWVIGIGFPAAITIWTVIARIKNKKDKEIAAQSDEQK